jgi:hypothetical protein
MVQEYNMLCLFTTCVFQFFSIYVKVFVLKERLRLLALPQVVIFPYALASPNQAAQKYSTEATHALMYMVP